MATPGGVPVRPRRRFSPRLIVALVVVALTLIFMVQNRDIVQIRLFAITLYSPLWLLLVVMAVVGALIGILLTRRR
jgi:uncharacterized integral membrane protein